MVQVHNGVYIAITSWLPYRLLAILCASIGATERL